MDPDPTNAPPCPSFILLAANKEARKVTEHARNYAFRVPVEGNTFSPYGLHVTFSNPGRLQISLGRSSEANIYLPEAQKSGGRTSEISTVHASFLFNTSTGAVLLCDHSSRRTTETVPARFGHTVKFRPPKNSVLIAHGVNSRIAFGREKWYEFEIQWGVHGLYGFPDPDEDPYTLGPRHGGVPKRYVLGSKVGGGAYGTVWSCIDVISGDLMAVKKFSHLSGKAATFATREIQNLQRINQDHLIGHEHILEIIGVEGGKAGDTWGEVFMPLKLGNLKVLVETTRGLDLAVLADRVLRQMLLALTCIAEHNIVHRDIKPENILWEYDDNGDYHFRLGDFGLSNDPSVARTIAGTEPFMAPEVFNRKKQTKKVDIWSLFATIVWVRDKQFHRECPQLSAPDIHAWLNAAGRLPEYSRIGAMANMDPSKRPSAQSLLTILDTGIDNFTGRPSPSPPQEDLPPAFEAQFEAMGLGDDNGFLLDDAVERPYYEPYLPHFQAYGESSGDAYRPPHGGQGPKNMQSVYVNPGGATYDKPDPAFDDDIDTAVPEMWTTRAAKMTRLNDSGERAGDTGATTATSPHGHWDADQDRWAEESLSGSVYGEDEDRKGKGKWAWGAG